MNMTMWITHTPKRTHIRTTNSCQQWRWGWRLRHWMSASSAASTTSAPGTATRRHYPGWGTYIMKRRIVGVGAGMRDRRSVSGVTSRRSVVSGVGRRSHGLMLRSHGLLLRTTATMWIIRRWRRRCSLHELRYGSAPPPYSWDDAISNNEEMTEHDRKHK